MDHKTVEIIETKDVTFAERVPNLRGIVHSMPGPNAQHWFQPEVLDPNDSISQMVSSPPPVDSESVADTDNSAPTDNDEDSIDASEPQSDSIVITQENLDDYLDEELRLPERRTPKPRVHFDPDGIEAPTLAIEHGMFLLQLQVIRNMYCAQVDFKSAFQNIDLVVR